MTLVRESGGERAIPAANGWSREAPAETTAPGATARTVWRYRDDKGEVWTATGSFEPAPGEKGRLLATAVVARGGSPVSSK